ncbi:MAG: NAD(P)-dependent oxidoreductase [Terrisporobacter othiniensis]|uniref:NAD(P)-dependent oxidoreductase n=1 Tax=Terrisporobacter petrolearius TaxID=1460447 RepID=UPI001D16A957|nr:NAD(P)-dependent oxidoreductase [Terrisporobacter petrolearius]MCC3863933.1 NAD(P)-dependent oxidoreductase [Terrisporobacter petrolearius]MDU4860197.1 NAD(P)-dependent oxidoreductase [Terrisporobacter othiniensis]MDU6994214.1 NAD(P)-dependent oxidoreductase [Terrisporobacter othiniensis]
MRKIDINELQEEVSRCLNCKKPRCKANCPVETPIPEIIDLYKAGNIEEAGRILFENNPLSAVCGVICPHEDQCLGNCIKGIKDKPVKFHELETHISSEYLKNARFTQHKKLEDRIAIVGSGPAGITLAFNLAKRGYKITIFEKNEAIGGVLRYGIPDFRLSREVLDNIEKRLLDLNVKIRYNALVGPVLTIDKLLEDGYKAIFIGTGVWNPKPLRIKGESLGDVHYAINYLKSPKSFRLGDKVIIIGAGNVAMDAARTAKYYGAKEVTVVYRKDFEHMTATNAEIEDAKEEGVKFELFKSPVEIVDEGVVFIDTKFVEEDGKTKMVNVENSEKLMEADSVIIAVSQSPKNNIVSNTENLETNRHGLLVIDDIGHTTKQGVFASGDVVTGARTVVEAVAHGKKVADSIDEYCRQK